MLEATEDALLARARALAGLPLSRLAGGEALRGKGAAGELIERALGIAPSSRPEPDVPALGIEVKTLPVRHGRVAQSTWVCSASPGAIAEETWATSRARAKLARVLFVPIDVSAAALLERRVGTAFLWSPDEAEEATLRADWEDLADLVAKGLSTSLSARRGQALQLRPKAKDASVTRRYALADGDTWEGRPQGFYLRRPFVQRLVDVRFPPAAAVP
ncbi:MAG: DNA mismatch repair protein MutH [Deltaproteobacteria bacterium]|nr:DNA mismatch repair protein MutH [Deltaproteobacteria bacterium]